MKKGKIIAIGGLVIVAAGVAGYNLVNKTPDSSLSSSEKISQIITDGGCVSCHSANPELPFYSKMPVAGKIVKKDVDSAYKAFDIEPFINAIANGEAPNEVDLAKIEKVVLDKTMSPAKYYLVHWGSSMTSSKTDMMISEIANVREKFFENSLASAEFKNEPIRPIPNSIPVDSSKVLLGEMLYHDTRLSADGSVSCASCHGIQTGGVDNKRYSEGINKQLGGVNAPTVFNACFNFVQFWDGRANTLAEQAGGPPLNPVEMGSASFDEIVERLKADKDFDKMFTEIYAEGLSQHTITDAIEQYEKTLVTPNSAFDKYLKGEKDALTAQEINGYKIFKDNKCATCHAGVNMGGLTYELMGVKDNYFAKRQIKRNTGLTDGDNGRFAQTKIERDRFRFKTPGLRNIALTAPYFHDGDIETLEEAILEMGKNQSGKDLAPNEVDDIKAFLNTLTGEYKGVKLTNTNL
ncbi:MAG: cytochrome c peroxidase [Bacteroidales bacterium]|nr:cytochrome c peroxidase [Bacteroidales bacterium]